MIADHYAEAVGNPIVLQNELKQLCKINPNAPFCVNLQAPSSLNSASSAIHTYEKTGFTLIHNPMICTFEPAPVPLIRDLDMNLRSMTEGAISDWKYHLNSFQDTAWNVVLNEVSYDKIATFDSSKCDITISYIPSPTSSPDAQEPVGVTTYDFANHKAQIVIYYLKMTWDLKTTETRDRNYIYYHYTPIFSYVANQLATEQQIGTTISHELGHAFGLGHYVISEQEMDNLVNGNGGSIPSMMVPIVIPQSGNYYGITQSDIQQLKSLYGTNGFNSVIQPQTSPPISQTVMPSQPVRLPAINDTSNQLPSLKTIPSWVKNNAYYWSIGNMGDDDFVKGIQYLIQQKIITIPETTQGTSSQNTIPNWIKKDAKLWAQGELTDDDFTKTIQYLITNGIIRS